MKKGALDTKRTSVALLVLLLIIFTFIVYGQTLTYDFVWDDKDPNLIENRYLQYTSFKNVLHFWTKPYAQMYIPVPYTTWALIKEIGTLIPWGQRVDGFNPFAFHLFSILFHIFNGLLVFRILKLLIKNEWSAFFGTLIFILHPLQVESVVWITEFRGLLAAFFGFSSLYILINNEILKKKNISKSCLTIRYINSLILFVFGMLSKPSVVVIPAFAFLIYLLYFKEKFWQSFKKLIPFIVVTIPFIIMLRFVQPASYHTEVAPLWSRFFIWMDTINFYFLKTLIPYPLVVTYTRTFQTLLPKYWFYLEWIIPVLLVFFAVKLYKRNPIILLGLLLFIVGFLPVSGLVSFVFQKWSNVADRYVYFSMFGLGLVIAWLLAKYHNKLVWILLLDILLCFTLLTILIQIPVWKNSLTLWNHALIHGRPSTYAYNNRGIALQNNGEYEMALEDYKKSIILNSLHTKSYYNIGIVYSKNERPDSAITYYNKAIAQRKDYIDAYLNRGVAYVSLEEYDKAISDYNFVINLRSDDEMAYSNRGIAYSELGRYNEAISDFSRAIELNPQRAQTYYLRGKVNFFERNYTAALEDYNKALLLDDTFVDAYIKRALLYAEMGNFEQAINDINKASSLTQNDIEILITKGDIFSKEKYFSESAQAYTDAINIEPDCGILYQKRAVSYYFLGKYENARKDIQKAENLGIIIPKSFLNALEKK